MKNVNKQTQGHKKLTFLFSELKKNKEFREELKRIRKTKNYNAINKLADKYGLPLFSCSPSGPLGLYFLTGKFEEPDEYLFDMCHIVDVHDEYDYEYCIAIPKGETKKETIDFLNENWEEIKDLKIGGEDYREMYPVSINIHRSASKRDVLDFINKKWLEILDRLEHYDEERKRIRKRINIERDNFIWKNKHLPMKKLIKLTNVKFSKNIMGYADIYKIISLERKRRGEK